MMTLFVAIAVGIAAFWAGCALARLKWHDVAILSLQERNEARGRLTVALYNLDGVIVERDQAREIARTAIDDLADMCLGEGYNVMPCPVCGKGTRPDEADYGPLFIGRAQPLVQGDHAFGCWVESAETIINDATLPKDAH